MHLGAAKTALTGWIAVVLLGGVVLVALPLVDDLDWPGVAARGDATQRRDGPRPDARLEPEALALLDQAADLYGGQSVHRDITPAQLTCVQREAGMSDEELLDMLGDASASGFQKLERFLRAMVACIPELWTVESIAEKFTREMNAGLPAGADVAIDEGRCVLRYAIENSDDPARTLVGSREEDLAVLVAGMEACFDAESRAVVSGAPGAGAQQVGDDADLDELYRLCEAGNGPACDLLFLMTSEGTAYGELGTTCAGRSDGSSWCTDGLLSDAEGLVRPDSPGLEALRSECFAGDMLACDLLFLASPVGSDLEHAGRTCGERILMAVPDCRTRFG